MSETIGIDAAHGGEGGDVQDLEDDADWLYKRLQAARPASNGASHQGLAAVYRDAPVAIASDVRYGELRRLIVEHGRHQVWTLRNSGVSWEGIGDQLGIGDARARDWYLRWSHQLDQDYRERWGHRTVRVAIEGDHIRVLTIDAQPALPLASQTAESASSVAPSPTEPRSPGDAATTGTSRSGNAPKDQHL